MRLQASDTNGSGVTDNDPSFFWVADHSPPENEEYMNSYSGADSDGNPRDFVERFTDRCDMLPRWGKHVLFISSMFIAYMAAGVIYLILEILGPSWFIPVDFLTFGVSASFVMLFWSLHPPHDHQGHRSWFWTWLVPSVALSVFVCTVEMLLRYV